MFKSIEQRFEDYLNFLNFKTIMRRSVPISFFDNEYKNKSDFAGIVLRFKAGSSHESRNSLYEGFPGYCDTAHLLEHCIARRIQTENPKLFKLGKNFNAITGHYATVFHGKVKKRYWKDFFSQMIGGIRKFQNFDDERLLKIEIERISSENCENSNQKLEKIFYKKLFNNPWINLDYTSFNSLKFKPSKKEIMAFYEMFYNRRNLEIYVGKKLSKENLEFIALELETLPLGMKATKPEFICNSEPGLYSIKGHSQDSKISIGCVLNNTKKNSLDASLFNNVLEKRIGILSYPLGLCYSSDTSIQNYSKKINTIEIFTSTLNKKKDLLINAIIDNILLLKDEGINEKEFNASLSEIKEFLNEQVENLEFILDLKLKKTTFEFKNLLKNINNIKLEKFNYFLKKAIPEREKMVIIYEKT